DNGPSSLALHCRELLLRGGVCQTGCDIRRRRTPSGTGIDPQHTISNDAKISRAGSAEVLRRAACNKGSIWSAAEPGRGKLVSALGSSAKYAVYKARAGRARGARHRAAKIRKRGIANVRICRVVGYFRGRHLS